jgi:uncharacterized membrane protein
MNTAPLLASSAAIQIHVFSALLAFALGVVQLTGRKGITIHRVLGWSWCAAMLSTALSSFWIVDYRNPGPTSLILILSVAVLVQLPIAVRAARRHDVNLHRKIMRGLFAGAIVTAGAFTLLPGRLMYRVVFG